MIESSTIREPDDETSHLSAVDHEYSSLRISRTISGGSNRPSLSRGRSNLTEPPWLKRLKVAAVIFFIVFMVYVILLGIQEDWLDIFESWARKHKRLASLAIILSFIPTALIFIPIDIPLYLVAGFMYGYYFGFVLCFVGYNLGSYVGFFLSRHCFRDWFNARTRTNIIVQAIKGAVRKNAFILVLLIQIAPVMPYSMIGYFFGASDCPFVAFASGTALGVLPFVVFFVVIGSTMHSMADAANGGGYDQSKSYWYFFWGSGVAALACVAWLTCLAKRELDALVGANLDPELLHDLQGDLHAELAADLHEYGGVATDETRGAIEGGFSGSRVDAGTSEGGAEEPAARGIGRERSVELF